MPTDVTLELRSEVARRADHRCEYCGIHEDDAGFRHQVDHIISRKHGGASLIDNLAYACVLCNRSKGSDIASIDPVSGVLVRLFDPRKDRWSDHFQFVAETVEPLSAQGRVTVRLLCINAAERLAERRAIG